MIKKAFYFTSKARFVFKILNFLFLLFGDAAKQLHKKDKVNFKFIYNVTAWLTNNYNTHIAHYLLITYHCPFQTMEFGQLTECNMRSNFLEKSYTKRDE